MSYLHTAQKLEEDRWVARGSYGCPMSASVVESIKSWDGQGALDRGGGSNPNGLCEAVRGPDLEPDRFSSPRTHRQAVPREVSFDYFTPMSYINQIIQRLSLRKFSFPAHSKILEFQLSPDPLQNYILFPSRWIKFCSDRKVWLLFY